jgi:sec-independent protein translocase protein TatC
VLPYLCYPAKKAVSILNKLNRNNNAEMSFVDHLEALRWHVFRSILVILVAAIVAFFNIEKIFNHIILAPTHSSFPSYKILCWLGQKLHVSSLCLQDVTINFQSNELSTQFMMSFSSSFVFGFIVASPYVFWEVWRFIKPALSPFEIKQSRGIIFWVTLLFFTGIFFGYFILAPYTVNFFASYQLSPQFQNIFKIDDYLDTIISLTLGTGLVFQLPVFAYFLSKVGIFTPVFMKNIRKYAVVIILIVSAVITPPDVFSMVVVAIPLVLLYEISILISGRVQKKRIKQDAEWFKN